MSVLESARGQKRTLGGRSDLRKDQGVPLAEAGAGGPGRVRGMDAGWGSGVALHAFVE